MHFEQGRVLEADRAIGFVVARKTLHQMVHFVDTLMMKSC